ncbi:MAG: rubrerythrin family protein [Muribaculaceae bacterium]|nr:rubrerythrin family protein [Muribaculaceae bacterium]
MATEPKNLKGTKTEANLVTSYLAESSAYTRYTFYAQQATKEKYFPIAQVFNETAANELHHAKVYFKFLQGGQVTVPVSADSGVIGTTAENLACAAAEELSEGVDMYKAYAKVAQEEGFDDIAEHFLAIATIEEAHHNRFLRMLQQVKDGTVWKREKPITWKCLVCGYEYVGTEPPAVCPACDHPREHYIALDDAQELA